MDATIKAQWVAALRSGDYTQGQGSLKTRDGSYCCLGVLCAIAPDEVATETFDYNGGVIFRSPFPGDTQAVESESGLPTVAVRAWAKLEGTNPLVATGGAQNGDTAHRFDPEIGYVAQEGQLLAHLNDGAGFSFNQIADLIDYFL
jgi:hypothetical protein